MARAEWRPCHGNHPMEPIPNGAGVGGQSYRSETSLSGERSGWDEFALRNNRIFYREVQNLSHAPPQAELRGLERTPRFLNPQAMVFARKSEKHSLQGACAYLFIIHFLRRLIPRPYLQRRLCPASFLPTRPCRWREFRLSGALFSLGFILAWVLGRTCPNLISFPNLTSLKTASRQVQDCGTPVGTPVSMRGAGGTRPQKHSAGA